MNEFQPIMHLWPVLTNLPGIGVSLMDDAGGLLFVNDVALEMFFVEPTVAYQGKNIADFHSKQFVEERLKLIRRVLDQDAPIRFRHIYKARHLESKIWPLSQVIHGGVPKPTRREATDGPVCQNEARAVPGGREPDSSDPRDAESGSTSGHDVTFAHDATFGQDAATDLGAEAEIERRVLVVTKELDPDHDIDFDSDSKTLPDDERILNSQFIDLGFLNVLSPRELEVFVLLGHGLSVPEVAKKLFRSPKTIERHKTAIGQKLQVQGQAAITRLVTQIGLDLPHASLSRLGESW